MSTLRTQTAKPSFGSALRLKSAVVGLSPTQITEAEDIVRRHEEEIRHAWTRHFRR